MARGWVHFPRKMVLKLCAQTDGSGTVTWQADDAGTGGGASTISALTDVESTMGNTGEILQVDSAGTALEYMTTLMASHTSITLGLCQRLLVDSQQEQPSRLLHLVHFGMFDNCFIHISLQ